MDLANLVGKKVEVKFIPVPYLGTGVTEVKTVEGVLSLRTALGRTYVGIAQTNGVVIEKDIKDLQSVEEVKATPSAKTGR